MSKPVEFEMKEREQAPEEEDEWGEEETSFTDTNDDFYRFLVDGPREYVETEQGEPLSVFQG